MLDENFLGWLGLVFGLGLCFGGWFDGLFLLYGVYGLGVGVKTLESFGVAWSLE